MKPLAVRKVERVAEAVASQVEEFDTMTLLKDASRNVFENPELPLPEAATDTPAQKTRAERELLMQLREGTLIAITPEQYEYVKAAEALEAEKVLKATPAMKVGKAVNWNPGKV